MQINTFKQRLDSVLKDNAINRYVGNKKKGKVDFNSLYKVAYSEKVFKQKEERKGKDYSVSFLIDNSGSMFEDDYDEETDDFYIIANRAGSIVQEMCEVLDKLNIPNSVYAFGTITNLVKDFGQSPKTVCKDYLNCYDAYTNWNTNDALALHIVGNEICKKNKKNILIVVTDGQGDNYDENSTQIVQGIKMKDLRNAKTVLHGLNRKYQDLEVLCLAMNTKHAKEVYGGNKTVFITNVVEARKGIISLINRVIKRG